MMTEHTTRYTPGLGAPTEKTESSSLEDPGRLSHLDLRLNGPITEREPGRCDTRPYFLRPVGRTLRLRAVGRRRPVRPS